MSEEAVRQTRSQKRALERDVPPPSTESSTEPSTEPSTPENDSKKPKLDQPEPPPPPPQTQSEPAPDPTPGQDGPSRTGIGPEMDSEPTPEPSRLVPPLVLPLPPPQPPPPGKDEREWSQKQSVEGGGSDSRTDRGDEAGGVKAEPVPVPVQVPVQVPEARSRVRLSEPKVSPAVLPGAGEVKATIKVELPSGEQPVDMSTGSTVKKEKHPPSPDEEDDDDDDDDVIILSDNDSPSPPRNGLSHFKELDTDLLMKSCPEERERIIKQLKQELRLEEAKLVLLKKLRQSQIQKDTLKPSGLSGSVIPPPLIRGTIAGHKGSQQVATGRSSGTVIPPPLVRGGQQISSKHSQVIMPPLVRGAQPISVSPQQIQALRQQQQQQQQLAVSGGSGSGPPPLLLAPRASAPGTQGQRGLIQSGLIRVGNVGNASLLVSISQASPTTMKGSITTQSGMGSGVSVVNVNDTPASRQAAAKLALRKQLEKTLLEIPPPKPPAPEFNFLPSAANNEFIYLVGLEEVVQNLLDTFHRGRSGVARSEPVLKEPFTCTQCSTDFTCRWRKDKAKGGTLLCEDCMCSNQKKALKAEHTNRLKAAFVKALQQEQEIEQRILQQAASSPISHTTASSSSSPSMKAEMLVSQQLKQAQARASSLQHQHQHQHHHQHQHQHSRGQSIVHHHIKQSPQGQLSRSGVLTVGGARGVPHSFSSSSQLQSAVAAAALVSRPGVTMAYVNPSLSGHKSSSTVDARQREYLLDMIPSRSISQTANTWK